ncbi:LysM peptidoglycan-binding domain-containing protein [Aggregatilinea lenta]|uniref:LysM peptidoglycan-binding domain-containing protein n=1 Tax=Aggregatilinea lenta TaxID=913108 RepID=UPI000E5A1246|nr:LysM domain-containing protein [Aggregatilinea lenta]
MRSRLGTGKWIAVLLVAAVLVSAVTVPSLPRAQAQGTPSCPIQIVMQDMLILHAGPAWNTQTVGTLQAGNVVCLVGRDAATTWLLVGSGQAYLGWAPVNAFWANVPFTILPVMSGGTTGPTPIPPTATPVPVSQTYVVQWGDTLYSIAQRFGVTQAALAQANNIAATSWVYAGQVLVIPGVGTTPPPVSGTTYVVQRGDYLVSIAARYGLIWWQLAQANNIQPPYVIYPGQTLVIPVTG